jgi:hypothetical protein
MGTIIGRSTLIYDCLIESFDTGDPEGGEGASGRAEILDSAQA